MVSHECGPGRRRRFSFASALALSATLLTSGAPPVLARGGARMGGARAGGGARAVSPPRATTPRTTNVQNRQQTRQTYGRAPYTHGGRAYYSHHAYGYHRYRPYAWGVAFRPVGFFAATLAASAVAVTIANQHYWYDAGIWYGPAAGGYTVVMAPVGATVTVLPANAVVVQTNTYYYGGAYYQQSGDQYQVVAPPAGTVVENLPEGGEEVTIGDRKYVKLGGTYYQPIKKDGKDMYEVVEVKPAGAEGD
jgi:hypothetical protein